MPPAPADPLSFHCPFDIIFIVEFSGRDPGGSLKGLPEIFRVGKPELFRDP